MPTEIPIDKLQALYNTIKKDLPEYIPAHLEEIETKINNITESILKYQSLLSRSQICILDMNKKLDVLKKNNQDKINRIKSKI